MKKFLRAIRNSFVEGLIFIFPITIMSWLIYFIFKWLYGIFHFAIFFLPSAIRTLPFVKFGVTAATFLLVLIFIVLFGIFVNSFLGRWIQSLFDRIFSLIPIFKTFYESLKQISKMVLKEKPVDFSSVVLVEFPKEGSWAMGFITSKIDVGIFSEDGKEFYSVFVPTSPNPTTGFTIIVDKNKIRKTDISVEQALKFIVFVGSISETEQIKDKNSDSIKRGKNDK